MQAWGWLLAAAFVAAVCPFLTQIHHNFDEGVYILQAREILAGRVPYRDFFYHQTPLYPYALAAVGWLADSVFAYRLLSGVATAFTGLAVHALARRHAPEPVALLAVLLVYTAPLQVWGLLALPNAPMMALATGGIALAWLSPRPALAALAGALLALSILTKPLTLAAGIALGLALLASRERRARAPWLLAGGAATGLGAWALFHVASDGAFSEVLAIQLQRLGGAGGLEVWRAREPFRALLAERGVETALEWNVDEHLRAFWIQRARSPNHWLLALGGLGQVLLWTPLGRAWSDLRGLLTLWVGLSLAFSLLVWEPVWDHYFVQYLPPLALLAALPLSLAWQAGRPGRSRVVARGAVLALAAFLASRGVAYLELRRVDYTVLARQARPGEAWLTWDPFLNVVTGTRPACGVFDWSNVYGPHSLTARYGGVLWERHGVEAPALIACLEKDPGIRIGRGFWFDFLADDALAAWVARQPPERFVDLGRF